MAIKIYYYENGVNEELDKDLDVVLKKHGFSFEGSGFEFKTNKRDLSYTKSKEN